MCATALGFFIARRLSFGVVEKMEGIKHDLSNPDYPKQSPERPV
jgi:hypothetical protein